MSDISIPTYLIREVKTKATDLLDDVGARRINASRDIVLGKYQPLFSPEHLPKLTRDEFYSFLLFENNLHWSGLNRQGPRVTKSLRELRKALLILADDSQPLGKRLEEATSLVGGMGKGIASAVLLVMFPSNCGVWNNTSQGALIELELWPDFSRGTTFGEKYEHINDLLNALSRALDVDLWTLDTLMWRIAQEAGAGPTEDAPGTDEDGVAAAADQAQAFGLERHLHEFMRDNWHSLELGREWELYGEPGDDHPGYEYPTSIGRIDLLAKHRRKHQWLVVELKRNQTDDQTVGQVLRYMGWVLKNLAGPKDTVQGLVVAHEGSEKIHYALETVPNVSLKLYSVEFALHNGG